MPIYEYACQKCGQQLEVMQKISDKPLTKHLDCGGKLEKQWSNTSFQLKGAGWYVTDYASKKPADATSTTDSASSTDAKADTNKEAGKDTVKETGGKAVDNKSSDSKSTDSKSSDGKKETKPAPVS